MRIGQDEIRQLARMKRTLALCEDDFEAMLVHFGCVRRPEHLTRKGFSLIMEHAEHCGYAPFPFAAGEAGRRASDAQKHLANTLWLRYIRFAPKRPVLEDFVLFTRARYGVSHPHWLTREMARRAANLISALMLRDARRAGGQPVRRPRRPAPLPSLEEMPA